MSAMKERLGKCYSLAGRYAMDHPRATLVHGSIQGFGRPRIDHAWIEVETGDGVYEPITDQVWPRGAFDIIFNPEVAMRYSGEQMRVEVLANTHWGPWA